MKDHNKLLVSEIFYSLQGEGSTMGRPAIFLRLGGCNLLCDGSWRCDTIEVWQKGNQLEFKDVLPNDYILKLRKGAHLIITGGEPLLQKERIEEYINWFDLNYGFLPYIEIETNGTKLPHAALREMVDQWNVSPKLESSGVPAKDRIYPTIISALNRLNTIFKFVIYSEKDWLEIKNTYLMVWTMDEDKIWLMPAASTIKELLNKNQLVSQIALDNGVNFTTRLQVEIWDKVTGV